MHLQILIYRTKWDNLPTKPENSKKPRRSTSKVLLLKKMHLQKQNPTTTWVIRACNQKITVVQLMHTKKLYEIIRKTNRRATIFQRQFVDGRMNKKRITTKIILEVKENKTNNSKARIKKAEIRKNLATEINLNFRTKRLNAC